METLQTLGTALGLSTLAGIDLYFTVFFTGLAINLGWVQLSPQLQGLHVLGDPVVLVVAGVMLVIEFIIDKVPYADSSWDTIHTIIRPIGGAILGLKALGQADPAMQVVGVLLGGSVAFTSHSAKAMTRLAANTSPEPFSNIALSVGEDATVLGGLWFVFAHPIPTIFVVVIFVTAFWYFFPKFFRLARAHATAIIHRFGARRHAAAASANAAPPNILPSFAAESWLMLRHGNEQTAWALPCFTGKWKDMGRFVRGCLVGTSDGRLFFIGKKNFRSRVRELPLRGARTQIEQGQLYHRLILQTDDGTIIRLRLTRKTAPHLPRACEWIGEQTTKPQADSAPLALQTTGS